MLTATLRIGINKEKGFYGPGAHRLLELTEELGSLSNACQEMGMSYSKGRKIIAIMEEELGTPVLETRQGGKSGGGSSLTKEAKELMTKYSAFHDEANRTLQELFKKYFSYNEYNDIL